MAIKSFTRSTIENNIFYRSMLAGNTAFSPSDEDILAEEVLTGTQASVTFSSLGDYAADYQHLQIRATTRVTAATTLRMSIIRFNGDSGANYSSHALYGESTVYSGGAANTSDMSAFYGTGASNPAGAFGAGVIDILDPFETTKYTTIRAFGGQTGYNILSLTSGSWRNTDALTSITILNQVANSFAAGSRFTLIGLK